ncbi:MAG: hypothetical protein QMD46_07520 [Methanomicrobiales archaeon]|nr:hypothetical protein [Methanomicrobiales archaeon]
MAAGCTAAEKGGVQPPWFPPATTTPSTSGSATPAPTNTYVTVATPYPATPTTTRGIPTPTFRAPPTKTGSGTDYLEIFSDTMYFNYNSTALEYDVHNPPFIIEYNIIPATVTREVVVTSDYGSRETKKITVTSVDDQSWFEITVRDRESGQVIIQEGFGRPYQQWDTRDQIRILSAGSYHIDLRGGKEIRVDLRMTVGNS